MPKSSKAQTASDESNLTGEATPVDKKRRRHRARRHDQSLGRGRGRCVLRPASQSALQKIIRLIKEAQHLKAPSQRFTDKFGTGYTYGVLGLTLAMFFVWWLVFGRRRSLVQRQASSAFYRAMTLLVVASPCALVLSIPSAVLAAIAWGARRGILFRGGAAVENLADVTIVAMDKTGTLTTGELQVERVESFPPGREDEVAATGLFTGAALHASAGAGHHSPRQTAGSRQPLSLAGVRIGDRTWACAAQREWTGSAARQARLDCASEVRSDVIMRRVPRAEAGFSEVWLARDGLARPHHAAR